LLHFAISHHLLSLIIAWFVDHLIKISPFQGRQILPQTF
jgi:hypothetical protein